MFTFKIGRNDSVSRMLSDRRNRPCVCVCVWGGGIHLLSMSCECVLVELAQGWDCTQTSSSSHLGQKLCCLRVM